MDARPDEFDGLPNRTGWYWVTWIPHDVPEPVHVVVNEPPDNEVFWMHDEEVEHQRLTLGECRASSATWSPYSEKASG